MEMNEDPPETSGKSMGCSCWVAASGRLSHAGTSIAPWVESRARLSPNTTKAQQNLQNEAKRVYSAGFEILPLWRAAPLRAFSKKTLNLDTDPHTELCGSRIPRCVQRSDEMATGTVKFFNSQKGFGFIQQDGGGPDVFVHVSAVERAGMRGLVEGQKLSFDVEADRKSGKSAAANLQNA